MAAVRTSWRLSTVLGCWSGLAVAVAVLPFVVFVMGWTGAHCEPVPDCQGEGERAFLRAIVGHLVLSIMCGAAVRLLIDRLYPHEGDLTTATTRKARLFAFAITGAAILICYAFLVA
jgi:hypothetical protein